METEKGLQLDCPDQLFAAYVQQHFGSIIQNVLQKTGVKQFSFSSGIQQMERQRQHELEKKNELCRQYQDLASKPLEEQFLALVEAYPIISKISLYSGYSRELYIQVKAFPRQITVDTVCKFRDDRDRKSVV